MRFKAINGNLLVQPCEDPRTHLEIEVIAENPCGFAVVIQAGNNPAITPGAIVYFRRGSCQEVFVDGDLLCAFVPDAMLLGFIPASEVEAKAIKIHGPKAGSNIAVPDALQARVINAPASVHDFPSVNRPQRARVKVQ